MKKVNVKTRTEGLKKLVKHANDTNDQIVCKNVDIVNEIVAFANSLKKENGIKKPVTLIEYKKGDFRGKKTDGIAVFDVSDFEDTLGIPVNLIISIV